MRRERKECVEGIERGTCHKGRGEAEGGRKIGIFDAGENRERLMIT